MADTPLGKGKKNQDLIPTREIKPVGSSPQFHNFRVEYSIEVRTGNIHATYICLDCPLRFTRINPPLPGFDHHLQGH